MKQILPFLAFVLIFVFHRNNLFAQSHQWQQQVNMQLKVSLNEKEQTLDGMANMQYVNNSPDTLHYIWMHCWPNAYRNDKTAFSEQLLKNNRTDFYFSREEQRGYINQLQFSVNGVTAVIEDHPEHQDIIKLILPKPLVPSQIAAISTPFHVKLPDIFSRMGHHKGFYAITQWYPKPAVYDTDGWHPMPYLDQGEFYGEFGKYEVAISVPASFTIAATGHITDSLAIKDTQDDKQRKTLVFTQDNIHDFAWFAFRDYIMDADTLQTINGKTIQIRSFYAKGKQETWQNSIAFIKSAIRFRNRLVGEYPYEDAQVVDGYQGEGSGGMEYPTITVINNIIGKEELEQTIAHEIGHNWFYAALGSNERKDPWLDEGLNTYYDRRYEREQTSQNAYVSDFLSRRTPADIESWLLSGIESIHRDQPIKTPSDSLSAANYGLVTYYKTAKWLELMERKLGQPLFDSSMRKYYALNRFSHVHPGDLMQVFENANAHSIDEFKLLDKTGTLEPTSHKKIRPVFLFDFNQPDNIRTIGIGPLPGFNTYDGFMIGGFIHNYQLPLPRFRFFIAPMYGTASKSIAGLANISYSIYPAGKLRQVEMGVNAARFTGDEITTNENTEKLHYQKLSPYIRITAQEKDYLSKRERFAQFKSFFISEEEPEKKSSGRNLQQLKLYYADHRVLYPYESDLTVDITKDFTRLAFTGIYFFNYTDRKGGLSLRFFAGKFMYNNSKTQQKTLENDRYLLNLTGANGYEDYTYSNYFVGRNEYTGWMSQQIMMRDGGFKVRTDLQSDKVGKTDNWLTAINISSTIPARFNPLELLPVKIPLKIFADFGTYAGAWEKDNTSGQILFDAGLQLSLFRETVNIYIPVVNSQVFRDYNESILGDNKFWKTISFSIDIQKFSVPKLLAKAGL